MAYLITEIVKYVSNNKKDKYEEKLSKLVEEIESGLSEIKKNNGINLQEINEIPFNLFKKLFSNIEYPKTYSHALEQLLLSPTSEDRNKIFIDILDKLEENNRNLFFTIIMSQTENSSFSNKVFIDYYYDKNLILFLQPKEIDIFIDKRNVKNIENNKELFFHILNSLNYHNLKYENIEFLYNIAKSFENNEFFLEALKQTYLKKNVSNHINFSNIIDTINLLNIDFNLIDFSKRIIDFNENNFEYYKKYFNEEEFYNYLMNNDFNQQNKQIESSYFEYFIPKMSAIKIKTLLEQISELENSYSSSRNGQEWVKNYKEIIINSYDKHFKTNIKNFVYTDTTKEKFKKILEKDSNYSYEKFKQIFNLINQEDLDFKIKKELLFEKMEQLNIELNLNYSNFEKEYYEYLKSKDKINMIQKVYFETEPNIKKQSFINYFNEEIKPIFEKLTFLKTQEFIDYIKPLEISNSFFRYNTPEDKHKFLNYINKLEGNYLILKEDFEKIDILLKRIFSIREEKIYFEDYMIDIIKNIYQFFNNKTMLIYENEEFLIEKTNILDNILMHHFNEHKYLYERYMDKDNFLNLIYQIEIDLFKVYPLCSRDKRRISDMKPYYNSFKDIDYEKFLDSFDYYKDLMKEKHVSTMYDKILLLIEEVEKGKLKLEDLKDKVIQEKRMGLK